MRISFFGATKEVTGSNYLIETKGKRILVDCGMHQGSKANNEKNFNAFPFDPSSIDHLLLTHAHIDHSGLIPKLVKDGFNGSIFTTFATKQLCDVMLKDSAHIQEMDNRWDNKKRARKGLEPREPLYEMEDVEKALPLFKGINYNESLDLGSGIKATFFDAGHILGSAHILFESEDIKVGFSGDIGSSITPLLNMPSSFEDVDYLLTESTYGDRMRHSLEDSLDKLAAIIEESFRSGGKIIIPSFAVGRTQLLLYYLNKLVEDGRIHLIKAYLDSPLAINATNIYKAVLEHYPNFFSDDVKELYKKGILAFDYPNIKMTTSTDDSKKINTDDKAAIIISAAGMCNAGRILHHLKYQAWNPSTSIVFVGYQANGTLGRKIRDGADEVKILGEPIEINASVYSLDSFSAHADQEHLIDFVRRIAKKPKNIFIVHGEETAQKVLKDKLEKEFNIQCIIPEYKESFELNKEKVEQVYTEELVSVKEKIRSQVHIENVDLEKEMDVFLKMMKDYIDINKLHENTTLNIERYALKSSQIMLWLRKATEIMGDEIFDNYDALVEKEGIVDIKFEQKSKEFRKEYFMSFSPIFDDFYRKFKELLKPKKIKD
ncbi:MBL fold metallo-hydrolase [bacterium]|nr:MBL fold metallo-hydrolase [bacterium]